MSLIEASNLSSDILVAMKVCPDFKLTNSGPFIKNNIWTDFADQKILFEPELNLGFIKNNYHYWLDWAYEMLAENDNSNPLIDYSKDLTEKADGRFQIPWFMSFEDKGFKVDNEVRTRFGLRFRTLEVKGIRLERELVADRFGNPVVFERTYKEGKLDDICMVFVDKNHELNLRFDSPELWGYQQWYRSYKLGRTKVSINEPMRIARAEGSISTFVLQEAKQHVRMSYSEQTVRSFIG